MAGVTKTTTIYSISLLKKSNIKKHSTPKGHGKGANYGAVCSDLKKNQLTQHQFGSETVKTEGVDTAAWQSQSQSLSLFPPFMPKTSTYQNSVVSGADAGACRSGCSSTESTDSQ